MNDNIISALKNASYANGFHFCEGDDEISDFQNAISLSHTKCDDEYHTGVWVKEYKIKEFHYDYSNLVLCQIQRKTVKDFLEFEFYLDKKHNKEKEIIGEFEQVLKYGKSGKFIFLREYPKVIVRNRWIG